MNPNKQISLGTLISLSTVSLAAFLLSIWAMWIWMNVKAELSNEAGLHISDLNRQLRNELRLGLNERFQDLRMLSGYSEFQGTDRKAQENLMRLIKNQNMNFTWIGFVLPDGSIAAKTHSLSEGRNFKSYPWFSRIVTTRKSYIGNVHEEPLSSSPEQKNNRLRLLDMAFPVMNQNNRLIGIIIAQMDWEWAEKTCESILSMMNERRSLEGIITGPDGLIILGPKNILGQKLSTKIYWPKNKSWINSKWPDEIEYVSATSFLESREEFPDTDWSIIIREPVSSAWAPIYKIRNNLIWLSMGFLLLLTLLAIITARRISRPILKLTGAMRAIRQGNSTKAIPLMKEYREVDELSQSLKNMIYELESRAEKLREAEAVAMESQIAMRVAEASNQSKSAFLASMSHELRTPLNAILGFAQLITLSESNDPETVNSSIKHILNGGNHLLKLINQILDLAKIESGKTSYDMQMLDPVKLLKINYEYLTPLAKNHSIEMHLQADENEKYFINADPMRINQILNNLISNAIKYNRDGGRVDVSLSEDDAGNICFVVEDTGLGIPESHKNRVFEEFNRMGRELSDIEGTGIGLSITKQLVEHMGGKISFESKEGVGSRFTVSFPPSRAEEKTESEERSADIYTNIKLEHKSAEILYVEDNQANIDLMSKIIARFSNARLYIARTAEDGLLIADKKHPDVIIMDINLPGKNGYEALQELKTNPAASDIPVIAISASAMESDKKKGLDAGFLHYLTKPINIQELMETLNRVISTKN